MNVGYVCMYIVCSLEIDESSEIKVTGAKKRPMKK